MKVNHAKNQNDTTYVYIVRDRKHLLKIIIPFFERHSFMTEKRQDFEYFSEVVKRMDLGYHREKKKINSILTLAYKMNQNGKYRRKRHKY